jgi:hypothetical protein
MVALYLLLWRSRTAESVFRAFGTSGAVRQGVVGGEVFRRVVAPVRRNIQSGGSLLISSFSFSGANSRSVTEECWPIGDPVATQLMRRDKAARKNCVLITRTGCHGIKRGQFPSLSVILGSWSLPIELDHFGDFLQELGYALLAPRIGCRAYENIGDPGKMLERLRCHHIRL